MGRRMVNSYHVTLNDTTQLLQLGVATGTKIGLTLKGHDPPDCNMLVLQQGKS